MRKTLKLSILYGLIIVVAAFLILGFCIQKSYNPEIKSPYAISITSSNGQAQYDGGDIKNAKDRYDVLYSAYTSGTQQSFIAALFSGNAGYSSRIESVKSPSYTGYKMTFQYSEEQTIMLNGKEYAHATNSEKILKFYRVHFDVVETNGFATVNMYYEVPAVVNGTNTTQFYKRPVNANFDSLYKTIVDAM